MNRRIGLGVVAAGAIALAGVGLAGPLGGAVSPATVLAQGPGDAGQRGPRQGPPGGSRQGQAPDGQQRGPRDRGPRQGQGPDGQRQGPVGPMAAGLRATMQAVADSLGMTPQDLRQALRGQSLADVAAAHGVDQATLLQTIVGATRTQLDQAVADGRLTRGQADALVNVVQQFGPQIITRTGPGGGPLGFAPGGGPRQGAGPGRWGHRGDRGAMVRPVADLLGMTPQDIFQARQQGQSLAQIAAAKGIDQATLVQTITGAIKTHLDAAVAAGRLPQDRADAMLQRAQQEIPQMITRTEAPGAPGGPRSQRPDGARPDGSPRGPRGGAPPAVTPAQ